MITNPHFFHTLELLNSSKKGVLATVERVQGSGPREVGAWMAVFEDEVVNTIGGGHLEFDVIAKARAWLAAPDVAEPRNAADQQNLPMQNLRFALGPSLGQCCGGVVDMRLERISAADIDGLRTRLGQAAQPLALFGGGHVGKALIQVLGSLPFEVRWVDSRDEIFPSHIPPHVLCEHSDPCLLYTSDAADE